MSGGHMSIYNDNCVGSMTTTTGTNPTEQWYMNMRVWDPFVAGVANSYRAVVVLTQWAILFRRVDVQDSTANTEGGETQGHA